MTTRLTFLVHGPTSAQRAGRVPTAEDAIEPMAPDAAATIIASLGRVDLAWCSPCRPARDTAAALGLPAAVAPSLSDLDLGCWRGCALSDIALRDPAGSAGWLGDGNARPHGGETVNTLLDRVAGWLHEIGDDKGRCVAVTHAAVVRAAIAGVLGAGAGGFWRVDLDPLCLVRFDSHGGRWTLRAIVPPDLRRAGMKKAGSG